MSNGDLGKRLGKLVDKGIIPDYAAQVILENPELLEAELKNRQKLFPSIGFVPNIAQERALSCLKKPHPTYGDYPFVTIMTGGNGVGKTCDIAAILLPGLCLGQNFVNKDHCDYEYFREIEKLRKGRAALGQDELHVRIVCASEDMSESGSLYKEIKLWNPQAVFSQKGNKCYGQVRIGNVCIDVKTFDQDVVTHAGPTLDVVIFNEPPPQEIWAENIGRCRKNGRVFAFLTPVGGAAFLFDIIDGDFPDGEIFHTEASIYDNCIDIPGTRGHLSRRDIERLIRQWEANNPEEVVARRDGKFMNLSGSIFKNYNEKVHCIKARDVLDNWIIMQTVDPHRAKPPFGIWTAQTPSDDIFVIAEYPSNRWDQITTCGLTIQQICSEWDLIEQGRYPGLSYLGNLTMTARHGDPLMFNDVQPHSRETLQQIYSKYGYSFSLEVDNGIDAGHNKIREFLRYDPERVVDGTNRPRLYVFDNCKNTKLAFQRYGYKKKPGGLTLSENVDPTWKCIMDVVRYRLMKFTPYSVLRERLILKREAAAISARGSEGGSRRNPATLGMGKRRR